jgi:hypothetical protein
LPGNLIPAAPTDVMPFGLCSQFQEELRFEAYTNTYPDGGSDRAPLQTNPRRFFKMARHVTATQYTALRNFFNAHPVEPFYFYNLRETQPPFTWDPTGSSTFGRYVVVFDGGWSDQITLGRSSVSVAVREVA